MAIKETEQLKSGKRKSFRQKLGSFNQRENSCRSASLFACFTATTQDDLSSNQEGAEQKIEQTHLNQHNSLNQNSNLNLLGKSRSQQINSVSAPQQFRNAISQDLVLAQNLIPEQFSQEFLSIQNSKNNSSSGSAQSQDVIASRDLPPEQVQNSQNSQPQNKSNGILNKVAQVSKRRLLKRSQSQKLDSKTSGQKTPPMQTHQSQKIGKSQTSSRKKFESLRTQQNQKQDVLQAHFSEQTDQVPQIQRSEQNSQFISAQTSEIFVTESQIERFNALQPWELGQFESFEDMDQQFQPSKTNGYVPGDINGYYIQDNYNNNNLAEENDNDSWHDAQSDFEEPDEQFSMIACQQDLQHLQDLRENLQDSQQSEGNRLIGIIEKYIKNGQVESAQKAMNSLQTVIGTSDGIGKKLNIESWRATVEKSLEELNDYEDYVKSWDHGLVLHYRHRRGCPLHSFKTHAFFEVHPVVFSSLLREFDLIHTWSPYVTESTVLKQLAEFHSFVLASLWFPWPFKNRQMVYETTFFDVLEEKGCILLNLKSLGKDKWRLIPGFPEKAWDRVTVDIEEGSCMKLTPRIEDGVLKGVDAMAQLHVNPHAFEIPRFVISFIITIFAPFMYKVAKNIVEQQLTKGKGTYIQRMKSNKYFYEYLTKRVNGYAQKIIDQEFEKTSM